MDGRKRRMEKEKRENEKKAAGEVAQQPLCWEEASAGAALRELPGLFQARGLWLQALDRRGQCGVGLFGDVFSAGPVCLFSGSGHVCGREKGGGQGCGWH